MITKAESLADLKRQRTEVQTRLQNLTEAEFLAGEESRLQHTLDQIEGVIYCCFGPEA